MNSNKERKTIETELKKIQDEGIQADRQHLKQNMHTQFADPFEFAREYVVNSYDAMATACYISGRETNDTATITIRDNGKGMDYQRIQDYFQIFRSRKDNSEIKAIGRFGVGKMSVAAIPGLLRFAGTTSTGMECWRFETDTLIEDRPVILERIEPVPEMGTKFEITFKTTSSLSELLIKIHDILYKFVRYLDINVYFDLPELDKEHNPVRKKLSRENWHFDPENLGKAYHVFINGTPVEIILGLGAMEHEIYQNQVYITSKYNLISSGYGETSIIPHLKIRVNSDVFELTFGRHCLSNETVLHRLSDEIRDHILPQYFDSMMDYFSEDFIVGSPELVTKIEEMACSLIAIRPGMYSWSNFQLFKVHGSPRKSYNELLKEIKKTGILYIEALGSEGVDYGMFNASVLKFDQPAGGLELLQKMFGSRIVNLNKQDVVIEAPVRPDLTLTPEEKYFERFLIFNSPKKLLDKIIHRENNDETGSLRPNTEQLKELNDAFDICEEAKIVERDLNSLIWRVSYLMERDGSTPCNSRKFLYKEETIILNLYHPEIREFIELSCINAKLAAHWAMAMCLSDPKLISHITPEAREDLLLIDAMGRLDNDFGIATTTPEISDKTFLDFLRDCGQKPSGELN
jgi:hypothetical protein